MYKNFYKTEAQEMYKKLEIELIYLQNADIVRTSPEGEWSDENADEEGWV